MKIILYLSNFIIPLFVFYIITYALLKKKKVYEDFIAGAKDGLKTVVSILPTLIGLLMGINILRSSGLLEAFSNFIAGAVKYIGIPAPIIPVIIIRMFSSSAATGLCLDIFEAYGTDSVNGFMVSILMSCTETIFYTMSVYFMAAKVTKIRWTLAGAMVSTLAGVAASVFITYLK